MVGGAGLSSSILDFAQCDWLNLLELLERCLLPGSESMLMSGVAAACSDSGWPPTSKPSWGLGPSFS